MAKKRNPRAISRGFAKGKVWLSVEPPIEIAPGFVFSRKMWDDIGDAVVMSTIENIVEQKQINGGPLKVNSPMWLRHKRKLGKGIRSLVYKDRSFVNSSSWKIGRYLPNNKGIVVTATRFRDLIKKIKYTSLLGYTGYLGLNRRGRDYVAKILAKELARQLSKMGK